MKALAVAVCLCLGAATTAEAAANCAHSHSWQCEPAPAPEIGSGIPAALAVGGVLLGMNFYRASAQIRSLGDRARPARLALLR